MSYPGVDEQGNQWPYPRPSTSGNDSADRDAPNLGAGPVWTGHTDAPFYRRRMAEAQRRDALGLIDELSQHDLYAQRLAQAMEMLANVLSPTVYPDLFPVPANSTITRPYSGLVGIWELDYVLLMPPGGAYPSRVDVQCPGIANTVFSLTSAKPELANMGFRVFGGQQLICTNADATNAATLFVRWKMSKAGLS